MRQGDGYLLLTAYHSLLTPPPPKALREDDGYVGVPLPRLEGEEYFEMVDEFMQVRGARGCSTKGVLLRLLRLPLSPLSPHSPHSPGGLRPVA